ncbi:HlyD family efflux transporter periplasmic adaptor subunit [Pleurocapsales cyanobacterium LEGE 10410]|nr:HlyD family efflux transporter periplasmic adaptor subunit [Pleurocapsales cyanobacterium LEGE 10410]
MIQRHKFYSTSIVPVVKFSASAVAVAFLSLGLSGCGGGEQEAQQPQAIAVKLKTLESATLIDSSEYVGSLQARDRVSLAPRTDGRILEIFVRQGDRVPRGEPIVRLEPTQEQEDVNAATQAVNVEQARLGQVQAELRTAEANRAAAAAEVESARADVQDLEAEVELAQINIERTRTLVEGGALPQQNLDDDNRDLKSTIAQLNSRQETLNAARKSLQAAERQVEQARANIGGQEAAIAQAEAELGSVSQNLAFNTINAPIEGIVGSFDEYKVGDYVNVGEQLTTITSNQSFDLNVNIPVEYRDRLQPGLTVETINQDGSTGIEGEITYIAPLVQQNTQSILAKATFANSNSLRDREYLRVRVIWDESPGVLVPTTAVSTLGGQNFVYLAKEQSEIENNSDSSRDNSQEQQIPEGALIAQQQPIKLGRIQDQAYQVISGLQEGDRIAVSNILSLQDGTAIEPAEEEQQQAVSNAETEAE